MSEKLARKVVELRNRPPPEDLAALEEYVKDLTEIAEEVLFLGDGMDGQRWFRLHSELVESGIWAELTPCSRAVLVTLADRSDGRKRTTIVGVEKVARLSGLSVPRTLFAYRELKDYGLIWRRRIKLNGRQPYMTGLTNPYRWAAAVALSSPTRQSSG